MVTFSKYHGCGNNFVILQEAALQESLAKQQAAGAPDCGNLSAADAADAAGADDLLPEAGWMARYGEFACRICDDNIGVGADGMIIVRERPALEMLFFNCDGSRGPMCGNGIRCFARYCWEKGICSDDAYAVKTLAGDMIVNITSREPFLARINMGKPVFSPASISVDFAGEDFLDKSLMLGDGDAYTVNSLFMGTVHTVVFVQSFEGMDIPKIGAEICNHPMYKEKTNVNFVRIIDEKTLEMKTYERGVGMTLACGTGACASVVAANLQGMCRPKAEVVLKLGRLKIEISHEGDVYMEGPATKILDGTFY